MLRSERSIMVTLGTMIVRHSIIHSVNKQKMAIDGILLDKKTLARKRPTLTTDDVIAALTFGFWTNFFRTLSLVDAPEFVP